MSGSSGPVLVVGRNGQVARELDRIAAVSGREIVALGRVELDLAEPDHPRAAIDRLRPAAVINAAAYTAVDKAESEPDAAFAVNAGGAGRLAEACHHAGIPLVHISTDYVFDGGRDGAWTEGDPVDPLGVYGRSKAEGEAKVREATAAHVILRTAWVFAGHGGNFVRTMLRLGRERDALGIVDDQRGGPTAARDIAAACAAITEGLLGGREDGYGTFHYAGRPAVTWFGFAEAVFRSAARHGYSAPALSAITTADYPTPAPRPANSVLDCARIGKVWGIEAPDWRPALDDAVDALLEEV